MNTFLFKYAVSTLGVTFLTISVNGLSARAETQDFVNRSSEAIAPTAGADDLIAPTDSSNTIVTSKTESDSEVTTEDTAPLVAQFRDFGQGDRSKFSIGVGANIGITPHRSKLISHCTTI